MVITNEAILLMFSTLTKLKTMQGVKFAYAVVKNKSILKDTVDALAGASADTPEDIEYEKKRIELVKSFSKKDEKGEAKVIGDRFDIDNLEAFKIAFEKFQEDNKEVLDKKKKQVGDFQELLKQEVDVDIFKVDIEDVPSTISIEEMEAVMPMVEVPMKKEKKS